MDNKMRTIYSRGLGFVQNVQNVTDYDKASKESQKVQPPKYVYNNQNEDTSPSTSVNTLFSRLELWER